MPKTRQKLNARQLVNDVREGMDDTAIMSRYGLSHSQLDKLFVKLVKLNLIAESELENRSAEFVEPSHRPEQDKVDPSRKGGPEEESGPTVVRKAGGIGFAVVKRLLYFLLLLLLWGMVFYVILIPANIFLEISAGFTIARGAESGLAFILAFLIAFYAAVIRPSRKAAAEKAKYKPDPETLKLLDKKDLLLLNDITSGEQSKEDVLRLHRFDRIRHHLDEAQLVEKCAEFLRIGAISQHQHDSFLRGDYRLVVREPTGDSTSSKERLEEPPTIDSRKERNRSLEVREVPTGQKARNPGRKLSTKQIVAGIRSGMDDVALMQKYGLSAKQLSAIFDKLAEKGLLQ